MIENPLVDKEFFHSIDDDTLANVAMKLESLIGNSLLVVFLHNLNKIKKRVYKVVAGKKRKTTRVHLTTLDIWFRGFRSRRGPSLAKDGNFVVEDLPYFENNFPGLSAETLRRAKTEFMNPKDAKAP